MPILLANFALQAVNSSLNSRPVNDTNDQRSLWDIFWSCVVTIFACTWIAIHPNIPAVDDMLIVVAFRRGGLMLCGMVAPEIIILWSMRQWYSARRIGQAHKDKGWTTTHGFFLQMGGFMMHDGRNHPYPIQLKELEARHTKGEINWPKITEIEIQDRSKGDALSKGIVILQTSWFLVQCIGRQCVGLAITELELVTLAFAALNIVIYFFWWNKPVDVRCPHPIYSNRHDGIDDAPDTVTRSKGLFRLFRSFAMGLIRSLWFCIKLLNPPIKSILHSKGARLLMILAYIQRPASLLLKFLLKGALAIKGNNAQVTRGRVPTLYAAHFDSKPTTFFLMTLVCAFIGSVFGGVHCIAWSFQFIYYRDQLLWRVSSLTITCAPLPIALLSNDMSRMEDDVLIGWVIRQRSVTGNRTVSGDFLQHQSDDIVNEGDETIFEISVDSVIDPGTEEISYIPPPPTAVVSPRWMPYELVTMEPQPDDTILPISYRHSTHLQVQQPNALYSDAGVNSPLLNSLEACSAAPSHVKAKSYKPSWWCAALSIWRDTFVRGRHTLFRWYNNISYWLLEIKDILPDGLRPTLSMWRHTVLQLRFTRWLVVMRGILLGTAYFGDEFRSRYTSWRYALMTLIWVTKCILLAGLTSAYATARVILIVQALMALKTLSPRALQAMDWTSFIPHF